MEVLAEIDNIFYNNLVGKMTFRSDGLEWNAIGLQKNKKISLRQKVRKIEAIRSAMRFSLRVFENISDTSDDSIVSNYLGFKEKKLNEIRKLFIETWCVDFEDFDISLNGSNKGILKFREHSIEMIDDKPRFDIEYKNMEKCSAIKNDVIIELQEQNQSFDHESVCEIRFSFPPKGELDSFVSSKETEARMSAPEFASEVIQRAELTFSTKNAVVKFKERLLLTPRGRYEVSLSRDTLFLHGKTYSFKTKFTDFYKMFLLPENDNGHNLVIYLRKPLSQGKTLYPFIILNFKEEDRAKAVVDIPSSELEEKYNSQITRESEGFAFQIVTRTIKVLSGTKVFTPGTFESAEKFKYVRCALKANFGFLYPLEASIVFANKPVLYFQHSEIQTIEFLRIVNSLSNTKMFDIAITLKPRKTSTRRRETVHLFQGISKKEFVPLFNFFSKKNINVLNASLLKKLVHSLSSGERPGKARMSKDVSFSDNEMKDDSESTSDEDFDEKKVDEFDVLNKNDKIVTSGSESDIMKDESSVDDQE